MTIQEACEKLMSELEDWYPPGGVTLGHNESNTIYVYEHKKISGDGYFALGPTYYGFQVTVRWMGPVQAGPANPVKENYEGGECPDCGDDIADDVSPGDGCDNCGHVFWPPVPDLDRVSFRRCTVHLQEETAGGYSIISADLPGVGSQGDTIEQALSNIREAFEGVIDSYLDAGKAIPWSTPKPLDMGWFTRHVDIEVPGYASPVDDAAVRLSLMVDIDPEKMSGQPCFVGTRFPIAQFYAELKDSSAREIAKNFDLSETMLEDFLDCMSVYLKQIYSR